MDANDIFNPTDFKFSSDIAFSAILRFVLIQIAVAKAQINSEAYYNLVSLLETLLSPYFDEDYNKAITKTQSDMVDDLNATHPKSRDDSFDMMQYNENERKLQALVKLMSRRDLLLDKSKEGQE